MKQIALLGSNGPILANVLSALLKEGRSVDVLTTNAARMMLDTTNVTVQQLRTETKDQIRKSLEGFDVAILAYETDFTDKENNDFILRTYYETVDGVIDAGVRRLVVVGNKDSEAFFKGELRRRAADIDWQFVSTEGDYAGEVAKGLTTD